MNFPMVALCYWSVENAKLFDVGRRAPLVAAQWMDQQNTLASDFLRHLVASRRSSGTISRPNPVGTMLYASFARYTWQTSRSTTTLPLRKESLGKKNADVKNVT
jgi:hypothetical protein